MDTYLVRHAHAGARLVGSRDRYRPLSEQGHEQAQTVAAFFNEAGQPAIPATPYTVLSSPAVRCVQTAEAIAGAVGVDVIEQEELWEDSTPQNVLNVLEAFAADQHPSELVVCTHGNLIPAVIEMMADRAGIDVRGRGCERASVWLVRRQNGRWTEARYLSPRTSYR